MLLRQHVVGQRRGVGETLQRCVEEAGVAHVLEAGTHALRLAPPQAEALGGEEDLLGQGDAIPAGHHHCSQPQQPPTDTHTIVRTVALHTDQATHECSLVDGGGRITVGSDEFPYITHVLRVDCGVALPNP